MNTKVLGVNIKTLLYQVPGGMLSNLVSQLKEAGAEDKYRDVLEEIQEFVKIMVNHLLLLLHHRLLVLRLFLMYYRVRDTR